MIVASIITYNPDYFRLLANIRAIYRQVNKVIIIDNNSKEKEFIEKIQDEYNDIEIIQNSTNKGIAYALNTALNYAKKNKYEWIITLDQDSVASHDMVKIMYNTAKKINKDNTLIIAPLIRDENVTYDIMANQEISNDYTKKKLVITSGNMLNVDNAILIKGFINELFIDYVDFEFCLRAYRRNFEIYQSNRAILYHQLGEIEEKRFGMIKFIVTNHNEVRRYYAFRNKILIYKEYWNDEKKWILSNILSSVKTIFLIILFEKYKIKKLKAIINGINDGFKLNI